MLNIACFLMNDLSVSYENAKIVEKNKDIQATFGTPEVVLNVND